MYHALEKVKEALTKAGVTPASAEIAMVPQNYIKLTGPQATQMVRLVEALEEHDDVQHVYANYDIDESEIQAAVGANYFTRYFVLRPVRDPDWPFLFHPWRLYPACTLQSTGRDAPKAVDLGR